ncbi:MAG: HdeD family acid-resistance protein [Thermoleophilia bacterium]
MAQPGMVSPQPHMHVYDVPRIKWSWLIVLGAVMLVLGALAIIFPVVTSVSIDLFLGILLLVGGAGRVVHMFSSRGLGDFLLRLFMALVFLIAGVFLVARPVAGTLTLTLMLGIFFVVQGAANVVGSIVANVRGRGWMLFNGLVSFVLGILIWTGLPSSAAWAIGLLVGIYLIFDGWALMVLAWEMHSHPEELPRPM